MLDVVDSSVERSETKLCDEIAALRDQVQRQPSIKTLEPFISQRFHELAAEITASKDLLDEKIRKVYEQQKDGIENLANEFGVCIDDQTNTLDESLVAQRHKIENVNAEIALELTSQLEHQEKQLKTAIEKSDETFAKLLEQSRAQMFRALDLCRERLGDIAANNKQELEDFVAAEWERHEQASKDTLQQFAKERQNLALTLENLTRDLNQQLSGILGNYTDKNEQRLNSIEESLASLKKELREDTTKQLQINLENLQEQQTSQANHLQSRLQTFIDSDLKHITDQVKFLDGFLDRFQELAKEERQNFITFLQEGDQKIQQAIKNTEATGLSEVKSISDFNRSQLEQTLLEVKQSVSKRLRLVPQKFNLPAWSYALLVLVVVASLSSAVKSFMHSPNSSTFTPAIAAIAPPENTASIIKSDSHQTPASLESVKLLNNIISGNRAKKRLSMTFDGGSNAKSAEDVLNILREKNIKTTLFLTGEFIINYPDLTRQALKDGHEIGNHTWNHPDLVNDVKSAKRRVKIAKKQLLSTEKVYYAVTGQKMAPLWRAPFGSYNDDILKAAKSVGYTHVYWTTDTLDWTTKQDKKLYKSSNEIRDILMTLAESDTSGNGKIVLMHLGNRRKGNDVPYKYLNEFFDTMLAKGYKFVRVSELVHE